MKYYLFCMFLMLSTLLRSQSMKGVNIVGPFDAEQNITTIKDIAELNANWISLTPEAKLNRKSIEINESHADGTWTQSKEGYISLIEAAKAQDMKIVLKPHLILEKEMSLEDKVLLESYWRGNIDFYDQEDWLHFEKSYRDYILQYAEIAERFDIELLVIGTELKSSVQKRPEFWNRLIEDIKDIYDGELSYSANWDNYQNVPFWEALSHIAINGYFPVSHQAVPEVETTIEKWEIILAELTQFANKFSKKIIISEFGYRNIELAGAEPWLHVSQTTGRIRNDQTQYNLYQAFFESVWRSKNILGGFVWNWPQTGFHADNLDFSIQNKPAYHLIKDKFCKNF